MKALFLALILLCSNAYAATVEGRNTAGGAIVLTDIVRGDCVVAYTFSSKRTIYGCWEKIAKDRVQIQWEDGDTRIYDVSDWEYHP